MANVASTIKINVETKGTEEAVEDITLIGKVAEASRGLIVGMAVALVGFALDGLKDATKDALEFGDTLAETSARLDVTAESLQRLQSLAFGMNTDIDGLTKAFESSKQMIGLYELGNAKAAKAIGLLGDEVKNAIRDGKSSEEVFLLTIKAVSEYTDVNERAAVALKAGLTPAMLDMATAYAQGNMTLEELKQKMSEATIISEEQANKASELNDKWDAMAHSLNTSVKSAFIELGPVIITVANALSIATTEAIKFWNALAQSDMEHAVQGIDADPIIEQGKKVLNIHKELEKAQKNLESQGENSAARPVAQSYVNKLTNEYQQAEKSYRSLQQAFKTTLTPPEPPKTLPPAKPVGATGLGKEDDDKGDGTKKGRLGGGGGSSNHEAELKKQAQDEQRYADEVERITDRLADNKNSILMRMTTNNVEYLKMERDAALKSQDDVLKHTKLQGKELEDAKKKVEENKTLITKQYAQKIVDIEKDAQKQINKILDDGELELAKGEKDKLKAVQLSTKAQIKSYEDRYDAEIKAAKDAGKDTAALERQKAQLVAQATRQGKEEEIRISGGYWDKLTQQFKDTAAEQGSVYDQMTTSMVDLTVSSVDDIANSFAEMAISGKASWEDMAKGIIKQIEMIIAKMLIMYAIQLLTGSTNSSTTNQSSTAAQNAATITPNFQSGNYAMGGAFSNGVEFFAEGDVVNRATSFGMANGKTGVMGEAGPEAIMPLSRGSDGKLGVRSNGGGTDNSINIGAINVTLEKNEDETEEEQSKRIGKAIKQSLESMMDKRLAGHKRPGGILNPTQVSAY